MKLEEKSNWIVLPGVPIGSKAFERLRKPMEYHDFEGLGTTKTREDWRIDSFAKEIRGKIENKIVLGQDFGGLVGATASLQTPIKALVLTGSALGWWWNWTRWSALPGFHLFFYSLFQGSLFVRKGLSSSNRKSWKEDFERTLSLPDLSKRMRNTARVLRPPKNLALRISAPVFLVWGTKDPWYPPIVAKSIARSTQAPIYWIQGGHYCMWESATSFERALCEIESLVS